MRFSKASARRFRRRRMEPCSPDPGTLLVGGLPAASGESRNFSRPTCGSQPHWTAPLAPGGCCGRSTIRTPATRWLLVSDRSNPGGPGRLVLALPAEGSGRFRKASSRSRGLPRADPSAIIRPATGWSSKSTFDDCRRLSRGGSHWGRRRRALLLGAPVDRRQSGARRCDGARTGRVRRGNGGQAMSLQGNWAVWLWRFRPLRQRRSRADAKKAKPPDASSTRPRPLFTPMSNGCAHSRRPRCGRRARSGARRAGWCAWAPTPRRSGCTTWFRSW